MHNKILSLVTKLHLAVNLEMVNNKEQTLEIHLVVHLHEKIITTTINNSKCYRRNSNNLKIRLAECRTMACQIITCQMHLASNNNKCHQHHVNNNKCRLGEG